MRTSAFSLIFAKLFSASKVGSRACRFALCLGAVTVIAGTALASNVQGAAPANYIALKEELLRMRAEDQLARGEGAASPPHGTSKVDAANTARLKEIVAMYGWPTVSMVGSEAASAAWLLAQHADRDRAFQASVLVLMEKLLDSGEASRKNYAYLFDRINEPQHYGTQGTCLDSTRWVPRLIEDEANVDKRRAEAGLPPMSQYIEFASKMCGELPLTKPPKNSYPKPVQRDSSCLWCHLTYVSRYRPQAALRNW